MKLFTAGIHQDLVGFGSRIVIIFRAFVEHSVIANLSTNNRALLTNRLRSLLLGCLLTSGLLSDLLASGLLGSLLGCLLSDLGARVLLGRLLGSLHLTRARSVVVSV